MSRVLPSMRSDNFAQDSNILLPNLVLLYNYYHLLTRLLTPSRALFTDHLVDLSKRLSYLSTALTQSCLASFEHLPTFSAVLCAQDLKEYGLALDELSEDLGYLGLQEGGKRDALDVLQRGLWDQDGKQVIVEMVKEQVMGRLREALGYAAEAEAEEGDGGETERQARRVQHRAEELGERLEKMRNKIA